MEQGNETEPKIESNAKETDVDTGVAKRMHNETKNDDHQSTSSNDTAQKTPTKVINVAKTKIGSTGNSECSSHNDASPSASPPRKKLISALKEKLADEERAQRVKLAHEIATNDDFSLPDSTEEPPPASDKSPEANFKRLEKSVKDIVHRAFWDVVRNGIESDPPNYDHAFILLQEIKDIMLSLLPQNRVTQCHKRIMEYMDLELFKQQAEHDALDVKEIANFIVDTMASMCAPIRDEQVAALRSVDDIVDLFKEIHKVLGLMKIDFANFAIKTVRPHIQQKQFEYERAEFTKLLKNSPDGLKKTHNWISITYKEVCDELKALKKQMENENLPGAAISPSGAKKKFAEIKRAALSPLSILKTAYTTLLSPEFDLDQLPQTLVMDRQCIDALRLQVKQLVLVSSVMITSCGVLGQPLASHQAFLTKLKENLMILTDPESNKELASTLQGVSLQCWKDATDYANGKGPEVERCINPSKEEVLKSKLMDLQKSHSHPVYSVLYKRTIEYLRLIADVIADHTSVTPPSLAPPPAGLSFVASELIKLALQYAKLINLNKTVYGPFYVPILREVIGIPKSNGSTPTQESKTFPQAETEKGARRKLNLAKPSDEHPSTETSPEAQTGKYKVTGSLADLD